MAKTTSGANGGTSSSPSGSNGHAQATESRRSTRSKNSVEPTPSAVRERPRAKEESQPKLVNSIRPTLRRTRSTARRERRSQASEPSRPRPSDREASRHSHLVPEEIKQRFVQVGNKYHFPDGGRAFTDHGNRLTSPSENSEVIKSLISIAQARGWSDVTVSGTDRFKKEAWFAARVAGLDVRGYSPTEFENGRLIRALARSQAPAPATQPADPSAPTSSSVSRTERAPAKSRSEDSRGLAREATHEKRRTLHVGRLVDHGEARYLHDSRNDVSYYVRIETPEGERDIWGIDLHRALNKGLTRPQIGDEIGLRALRQDAVKVSRREYDAEGRVVGEKELGAQRNAWIVEKRDFFQERARAARVLRDPGVDRQVAVKQHPELVGTYLQLHAAELAAKTLRNPEDQRRFVESVRTALADSVARGEPLATVPLKEPAAQRPVPRAQSAPAAPEREAAPTR